MKYRTAVYDAVIDFYKENDIDQEMTREKVDQMSRYDVLDAYLKWEGIIGYTWIIADIANIK